MRTPTLRDALLLAVLVSLVGCAEPTAPTQVSAPKAPSATSTANSSENQPTPVPDHLREGKQLFDYWCAACHARGPGHPGTQALDARYAGALPGALEDRTNLTPEVVEVFVRNGISVMPFFRKTEINDKELAAIGAYLSYDRSQQPAPGPQGGQP